MELRTNKILSSLVPSSSDWLLDEAPLEEREMAQDNICNLIRMGLADAWQ